MTRDDLILMLRSVGNLGERSPYVDQLADWWTDQLLVIPIGEEWTSREVYASIPALSDWGLQTEMLNQALWRLREMDALEGVWRQDHSRRYFGKPLIRWRRPDRQAPVDLDF